MAKRGRFITFEGIEGVGKSTNIEYAKTWLAEQGIEVCFTREPGGTPLAESLRSLLLQDWDEQIHSKTELMLLFAGRCQHVSEVIEPALSDGLWVVSDRFVDATYAYQGYGRGLPLPEIAELERAVLKGLKPDCTILLDAEVSLGQERVRSRNSGLDRIEQEASDFFQRVRDGYLQRAHNDPERIKLIDAANSIETVKREITAVLKGFL